MIENNRLGKGLSSLLGERANIINSSINDGNVKEIVIGNIKPNRNQPRKDFDQNSIDELAQSIKEYGILQPVIVRKIGDANFELIAGERRLKACKKLNMKTIPAIIKNFNEEKSFILSVIENIQRENLNIVDEAFAYKNLIEECKLTQNDLSDKIGKSRSHIANILRLLNLSDKILSYLKEGKIEMGHARALINFDRADEVIDYIVNEKLTVRDVEKLVKGEILVKPRQKINNKVPEIFTYKENILKEKLNGFNFKLKIQNNNESGNIVLSFKNLDELNKIIDKIN